jgi:GntR family transcriptional regulator
MSLINRNSKLPLYQQVYEILHHNIRVRVWEPGDLIPPESELSERYQVSSITIRQALNILENEGLIYRKRGRGTFVAQPTLEQSLSRIISFTEDMQRRGWTAGTRVLSLGLVPADDEIAELLQVTPGEELARVERLRLANEEPVSIEVSYIIHRVCPGILRFDFATQSMRVLLEQEFNLRLVRARQTIRAISAPVNVSHLLSLKPGAAILFIERTSVSQWDSPLEFLRIHYRGDRYSLHNELQG